MSALGQNYPAIAEDLTAPTTISNPVTVAPQVSDYPDLEQLTYLATYAEKAAIDAIDPLDDWAIMKLVDPLVSDETKGFLWAIAMAAPGSWEGSAFNMIKYALEEIETVFPRLNGQLIFPDPVPNPPVPRTLLNLIGTVLVDQSVHI